MTQTNEKYTGTYIYNRASAQNVKGNYNRHKYKSEDEIIRVENAIPAIISKEIYEIAKIKMNERRARRGQYKAKEIYLLTGKVYCGECGSAYTGITRPERNDHPKYASYRCSKCNGSKSCNNTEMRREIIETFVLDKIAAYVFEETRIPTIISSYNEYIACNNKDVIIRRNEINKLLDDNKRSIDNITKLMRKSGLETLLDELEKLELEKKHLKQIQSEVDGSLRTKELDSKELKKVFRVTKKKLLNGELENKKEIVQEYVKKVLIFKDHIEVDFDFGLFGYEKKIPQNPANHDLNSEISSDSISNETIDITIGGEGAIRTLALSN